MYLSFNYANKIIQKDVEPFFLKTTSCNLILDAYDGSLNDLQETINSNQYTFIYLYADWCARSKKFRQLINNLACLNTNIKFIAINCFLNECQKTFNLVKYPQILLQIRDAGLYYYRGNNKFGLFYYNQIFYFNIN